jgi:hypothetical protein
MSKPRSEFWQISKDLMEYLTDAELTVLRLQIAKELESRITKFNDKVDAADTAKKQAMANFFKEKFKKMAKAKPSLKQAQSQKVAQSGDAPWN